jgi:hypothetical protein
MLELVKRNYAAGTMWAQLARTLGTQAPGTGGGGGSAVSDGKISLAGWN